MTSGPVPSRGLSAKRSASVVSTAVVVGRGVSVLFSAVGLELQAGYARTKALIASTIVANVTQSRRGDGSIEKETGSTRLKSA